MTRDELELLKATLKEAQRTDDGSGHWLPQQHADDLRKCINLVNRELRNTMQPTQFPRRTRLADRTIITNRDGSKTTWYDDDDLQ